MDTVLTGTAVRYKWYVLLNNTVEGRYWPQCMMLLVEPLEGRPTLHGFEYASQEPSSHASAA